MKIAGDKFDDVFKYNSLEEILTIEEPHKRFKKLKMLLNRTKTMNRIFLNMGNGFNEETNGLKVDKIKEYIEEFRKDYPEYFI